MTTKFSRRKLILKQPPVCRRSPPCLDELPPPIDAPFIECTISWLAIQLNPPEEHDYLTTRLQLPNVGAGDWKADKDYPPPTFRGLTIEVSKTEIGAFYDFYAAFTPKFYDIQDIEFELFAWPAQPPYRVSFSPQLAADLEGEVYVQLAVYPMP